VPDVVDSSSFSHHQVSLSPREVVHKTSVRRAIALGLASEIRPGHPGVRNRCTHVRYGDIRAFNGPVHVGLDAGN
jgi:hypothetical protein